MIQPLLDYRAELPGARMLRMQDGTPVTSFSRMVQFTSESTGVSPATLYKWLANFKEGGLPALADRQRADKGKSRFFQQYPKAAWLAAYLYLDERMSATVCHEAIVRDLQLLQIPPEDAPSYETVRAWLQPDARRFDRLRPPGTQGLPRAHERLSAARLHRCLRQPDLGGRPHDP